MTKEEERARKKLRADYVSLHETLSEIIFEIDPMGINFGSNTDEYHPEANTIIPRLKHCLSSSDVQNVVTEEFNRWFGEDSVNNRGSDRIKEVAAAIWDYYKDHTLR